MGSGFVIDRSGLVATNYHVIAQASSASVRFRNGTEVEVAGYGVLDKKHDLAILQLKDPPKDLTALPIRIPESLKQGDSVVAIGHPGGFEFTVTNGIVSAIRKTAEMPAQVHDFLKSDPECRWLRNPALLSAAGSSGGPVLNANGDVIGVVTWIMPSQGLGFAVHVQHLSELQKRLGEKVFPLPVPGSFRGPGVSEPAVLEELARLRGAVRRILQKTTIGRQSGGGRADRQFREPDPGACRKVPQAGRGQTGNAAGVPVAGDNCPLAHDESRESREALHWAFGRLLESYADAEPLGGLMMELCQTPGAEVHAFLRQVIAKSPHQQVRALGCSALGIALRVEPRTRGRNEEESIAALERAVTEFGGVEIGDTTIKEVVAPLLRGVKSLEVGRPAQEIEGRDAQGKRSA